MNLISETTGDGLVVTVDAARIDAAVAIRFKQDMQALIEASDGRIIVDLGRVDFIDSSGLGAIVAAMKVMPPNRRMELAALTPTVEKVFRMTRMDTIFRLHATVEDASAAAD